MQKSAFNLGMSRLWLPPKILLIMKLIIVIMTTCFMQVSASSFGQRITLSERNTTLEQVLNKIQLQTNVKIVYADDLMQQANMVNVKIDQLTLTEALDKIFEHQPLGYEIKENTVIVKKKEKSLLDKVKAVTLNLFQSIDVQGKIVDEKGVPIPGATVRVKGSAKAAVTDKQGMFLLSKVSDEAVLLVSYIGYETREIKADDLGDGVITLKLTSNDLNEVMINRGYYTEKQRFSVGNVTKVSGEDIAKQPVSDPLLALQGRVPGLYISQTSGVPGSYSSIYLRGQNSIPIGKPLTVNDPLFIVDGVPYSSASLTSPIIGGGAVGGGDPSYTGRGQGLSPFNSLNPADIESIEVLKDADATAIYGSRGSNGVILITTKRGKAGETKVDVDVSTGVGQVARKIDLLNTTQYLQMRREAFKNDGAVPDPNRDFDLTYWDTSRYTDWQKVLIGNTAQYTSAQASVSGGNANTQFQIGGGYNKQGTVFPGDYGDQRASLHFNITSASNNQKFKVQLTGSYSNDNNHVPQSDFTQYITLPPDAPAIYNPDGSLNWALKGGSSTWNNPLAQTFAQAKAVTDNLIGNMLLSYQLSPDLQIQSSFGYTHAQMNQSQPFLSSGSPPPDNTSIYSRGNSLATTDTKSWIIEPQLNYHKQLGKLMVDGLLGTTFQESSGTSSALHAYGFNSDILVSNPAAAAITQYAGYNASQYRYNAAYARLSAKWNNEYLLNITARRDGSSRFGPGKQFGNFGAIGAGWIFTEKAFVKNEVPWLSFGKLRASYGVAGNDGIGDYQFLSTYSIDSTPYQGNSGLFPTLLSNSDFAWERNKKLEGGLELGFIKDRINLSVSYYRNRTDNQLVPYPLPLITGFGSVQANLPAIIQNTGWEFTLNTINIKKHDFTWSSAFNLSIPKNKLVAYPDIEHSPYNHGYVVGKSLFIRYLFHYTGVNPETGIYIFSNKDGSGILDYNADNSFTKPITQQFFGGLQNSFRYKEFELDFLIQFVKQTGINYLSVFRFPGIASNIPTVLLDRWQKPGDQTITQQFTQSNQQVLDAYGNLIASDAIISDKSFIRVKSLSLSYQVPGNWIKRMKVKGASFFARGENLWTLTSYKVFDPETSSLSLPPLRIMTLGLHASF